MVLDIIKSKFADRSFMVAVPILENRLSFMMRSGPLLPYFKKALKEGFYVIYVIYFFIKQLNLF